MTDSTQPKIKNVYQKLQDVRVKLGDLKLKKTGKNTYSNFTYYELSDFLPALNQLNNAAGLMTFFEIRKDDTGVEQGYLSVINTEDPEDYVVFHSQTAEVEIGKKKDGTGGAERIQNIGGKQTYLRRYLFIMAYEISENDLVDAQMQKVLPEEQLDEVTLDQINSAKTQDELIAFCKEIKDKLPKQRNQIVAAYTARKAEMEKENEDKSLTEKESTNESV